MKTRTFGQTKTIIENGQLRRQIIPKGSKTPESDIANFMNSDRAAYLAHWISTIDKIARKPSGTSLPTQNQRDFRTKIGEACIAHLQKKGWFADHGRYSESWFAKRLHPYPDKNHVPLKGEHPPSLKGKWYRRFIGDEFDPEELIDEHFNQIAGIIAAHLDCKAYRISLSAKRHVREHGLIKVKGDTIATSTARRTLNIRLWNDDDWMIYMGRTDVASKLRGLALEKLHLNQDRKPAYLLNRKDVGRLFYEFYPSVMLKQGQSFSPEAAKAELPGRLALHDLLKSTYHWLVERMQVKKAKLGNKPTKNDLRALVEQILPINGDALRDLVEKREGNRDINTLIRIGKALHYSQSDPRALFDDDGKAWANMMDDETSLLNDTVWTSDRQSEIKRLESFTRNWRSVLVFANRTLRNWLDPDGKINDDLLGNANGVREASESLTEEAFDRKVELLFGGFGSQLLQDLSLQDKQKFVRRLTFFALELRNASFHFKSLDDFISKLKITGGHELPNVAQLWSADTQARTERLKEALIGVRVDEFMRKDEIYKLIGELVSGGGKAPIPRFGRVLLRYKNAIAERKDPPPKPMRLPLPVNRNKMEDRPALRCQYQVLKMLYERGFSAWLETDTAQGSMQKWINNSIKRATESARQINRDPLALSRADKIVTLGQDDGYGDFVTQLAQATASEMRVQKGYDPDPKEARKKSAYLDNLHCDVVGEAFLAYLDNVELRELLTLQDRSPNQQRQLIEFPKPKDVIAEDWQLMLYVFLHLVPIGQSSRLFTQLRKWSVLDNKSAGGFDTPLNQVSETFETLLDMYNSKFEGTTPLGNEHIGTFFEDEGHFKSFFPPDVTEKDSSLPLRGLREVMRFDAITSLRTLFERHAVTGNEVTEFRAKDRKVKDAQRTRESLHADWKKNPRAFKKFDEYAEALQHVYEHRNLASRVRLTDHVKLYQLYLEVLTRLIDFAALWERDEYFVLLALMRTASVSPVELFSTQQLKDLRKGKFGPAVGFASQHEKMGVLKKFVGLNGGNVEIRNAIMHLHMLYSSQDILNGETKNFKANSIPDLTSLINQTRLLMSYDRKLKNAVSKSVIDLLEREKLHLTWTVTNHALENATVKTETARHLGGKGMAEPMHGKNFVAMVESLFSGR